MSADQAARAGDGIPAGFKLVPVEPTLEMMRAGGSVNRRQPPTSKAVHACDIYRAMLAAAPAAAPAQTKPAQAFLCRAWGESDFPAAELVPDWAGVRAFMVREWTGSEDATADDGTNYLDELKEGFDAHEEDQRGGPYEIEFEIGGVSVERVTGFAFQAPATGDAA